MAPDSIPRFLGALGLAEQERGYGHPVARFGVEINVDLGTHSELTRRHENEHEAYVLAGNGELETPEGVAELKDGSAIFIPAQESHRFRNTGKDVMRFIDVMMFPGKLPQ